jgi:hypothetical protein
MDAMCQRAMMRFLSVKSQRGRRAQHHDSAPTDNSSTASQIRSHFLPPQDVARDSPRIDLIRADSFDPCAIENWVKPRGNDRFVRSVRLSGIGGLSNSPGCLDRLFRGFFGDKDSAESELYFVVTAPEALGMGNIEWMRYHIACVVRLILWVNQQPAHGRGPIPPIEGCTRID